MEGGVGSSRSSGAAASCLMMAFGDNNSMMMMPPITSSNNPSSNNNNTLSWNLCNASQFGHHQDLSNNIITNHHHHASSSSMMIEEPHHQQHNNNTILTTGCYFMENNNNNSSSRDGSVMKAKIMAHPHYHRLLAAYVNCQKIGAPPEVVARLEEACASAASIIGHQNGTSCVGEDPSLDQFMEAYCEMLMKYEQELSKPFNEAMLFLSRIESQFKGLTLTSDSGEVLSISS
ncbi:homeodomain transcription factor [Lithospermum erythrorhizon]|uniref:Homeodomain transcription factor n=1 Tax=Lithospermum erythrorhizon TaxID=34254 RepID=A0AAV3PVB1_LITER